MLVALVEFWNGLEPAGQAALVGVIASAVVALLQKAWPGLVIVPNQVKRALIALMAGLSASWRPATWGRGGGGPVGPSGPPRHRGGSNDGRHRRVRARGAARLGDIRRHDDDGHDGHDGHDSHGHDVHRGHRAATGATARCWRPNGRAAALLADEFVAWWERRARK